MRILFICTTEFQVINAINIRQQMFMNTECDILCTKERLARTVNFKKLSIFFQQVYLIDALHSIDILKKIFTCYNLNFYYPLFKSIYNKKAYLERKLEGYKGITNQSYSDVFIYSIDNRICRRYAKFFSDKDHSSIHRFDEGVGTYIEPDPSRKGFFESKEDAKIKIHDTFLYEPDVALPNSDCNVFVKIPKIQLENQNFIRELNNIFGWQDVKDIYYHEQVIFFDQPIGNPYYEQRGGLLKIKSKILRYSDRSQKDRQEIKLYKKKMKIIQQIQETIPNIMIKLHPNTMWLEDEYMKQKYSIMKNSKIPWEIFFLNSKFDSVLWITINSSSVLINYMLTDKKNKNIKVVFLYRLFGKSCEADRQVDQFLQNIQKVYKNIYIPNNFDELNEILLLFKQPKS